MNELERCHRLLLGTVPIEGLSDGARSSLANTMLSLIATINSRGGYVNTGLTTWRSFQRNAKEWLT